MWLYIRPRCGSTSIAPNGRSTLSNPSLLHARQMKLWIRSIALDSSHRKHPSKAGTISTASSAPSGDRNHGPTGDRNIITFKIEFQSLLEIRQRFLFGHSVACYLDIEATGNKDICSRDNRNFQHSVHDYDSHKNWHLAQGHDLEIMKMVPGLVGTSSPTPGSKQTAKQS